MGNKTVDAGLGFKTIGGVDNLWGISAGGIIIWDEDGMTGIDWKVGIGFNWGTGIGVIWDPSVLVNG